MFDPPNNADYSCFILISSEDYFFLSAKNQVTSLKAVSAASLNFFSENLIYPILNFTTNALFFKNIIRDFTV